MATKKKERRLRSAKKPAKKNSKAVLNEPAVISESAIDGLGLKAATVSRLQQLASGGIRAESDKNWYDSFDPTETCEKKEKQNGIEFIIRKSITDIWVNKQIDFSDKGESFHIEEKVRAFSLAEFEKYFSACDLKIIHLFGDYSLTEFDERNSERLIIVAKK